MSPVTAIKRCGNCQQFRHVDTNCINETHKPTLSFVVAISLLLAALKIFYVLISVFTIINKTQLLIILTNLPSLQAQLTRPFTRKKEAV